MEVQPGTPLKLRRKWLQKIEKKKKTASINNLTKFESHRPISACVCPTNQNRTSHTHLPTLTIFCNMSKQKVCPVQLLSAFFDGGSSVLPPPPQVCVPYFKERPGDKYEMAHRCERIRRNPSPSKRKKRKRNEKTKHFAVPPLRARRCATGAAGRCSFGPEQPRLTLRGVAPSATLVVPGMTRAAQTVKHDDDGN